MTAPTIRASISRTHAAKTSSDHLLPGLSSPIARVVNPKADADRHKPDHESHHRHQEYGEGRDLAVAHGRPLGDEITERRHSVAHPGRVVDDLSDVAAGDEHRQFVPLADGDVLEAFQPVVDLPAIRSADPENPVGGRGRCGSSVGSPARTRCHC